jgi:hypothetical protein
MNDPAASGRGILMNRYSKRRGKPRGIKPTGGIKGFHPAEIHRCYG